ncbi:hypothetical protein [Brevibacterium sp.]|uniref:hypothetical protein n=1 Tax=Brevibacterium sp. TaxID=1701 RepID=UPI0026497036|nr:hypothetical protein [Brevibacterium sp.]MDN6605069.1 hypothetical protein [Brevibacterium sp.]
MAQQARTALTQSFRRAIVMAIVVTFSLAALGGIIVLLGDIESEIAYQVLATTALTGVFSVATFCGATLIGTRGKQFGVITIGLAVLALALALWFVWAELYDVDFPWKLLVTACLLSACTSVASLILLLVSNRAWTVRIALTITLCLLALGCALSLISIWFESAWDYEWLTRLSGIVWILAALGVVVVPVSSLLLKTDSKAAQPQTDLGETDSGLSAKAVSGLSAKTVSELSPQSVRRIEEAARQADLTPDEFVDRCLTTLPDSP